MTQAKIVDINVYYRSCGLDWNKISQSQLDALILSAGVGTWANPLLAEHVAACIAHNMPYMTYWIPDITDGNLEDQVMFYLSLPGVRDAWTCQDIEQPNKYTRSVNEIEAKIVNDKIEEETGVKPLNYLNQKGIEEFLHNASWITDYFLWFAQWPWEPWKFRQYQYFETFFRDHANQYPAYVQGNRYQAKTVLWQFSSGGKAQSIIASAYTCDPVYPTGIQACDMSTTPLDKTFFMALLGQHPLPTPSPSPAPTHLDGVVISDTVNVRKGPGLNYDVVSQLHAGDKVSITNVGGPDSWVKIGEIGNEEHWIAMYYGGKQYTRIIE